VLEKFPRNQVLDSPDFLCNLIFEESFMVMQHGNRCMDRPNRSEQSPVCNQPRHSLCTKLFLSPTHKPHPFKLASNNLFRFYAIVIGLSGALLSFASIMYLTAWRS